MCTESCPTSSVAPADGFKAVKTHFQELLFLLGVVCSSAVVLSLCLVLSERVLRFQQPAGHRVQGRGKTRVQLRSVFMKLVREKKKKKKMYL